MADFKPNDLFVGIVDFFAVLLPGAVLTFMLQNVKVSMLNDRINDLLKDRSTEAKWVIFVIASYLFGHFVFLIGAKFLDDLYDATYAKRQGIKRRWRLLKHVGGIKREALQSAHLIENQFKWARAYVKLNKPEAATEIDRLEADSKFFRSMVVVAASGWMMIGVYRKACGALLLTASFGLLWLARNYRPRKSWKMTAAEQKSFQQGRLKNRRGALSEERLWQKKRPRFLPWRRRFNRWRVFVFAQFLVAGYLVLGAIYSHTNWWPVIGCFVVICLSAWRYADQRWKMTQTAYLYFVMLNKPANPNPAETGNMWSNFLSKL